MQDSRMPDMRLDLYRRELRSEEINALPIVRYEGEVRLVRSAGELGEALDLLAREDLLGFDTETRPSFFKGRVNQPALIQLAASERIFLVQLAFVPFGAGLAALLSNEKIVKAGVGIWDDMRELGKLYPFEGAGAMDLGDLARSLKLPTQGLRNMAANLLGWRISKGQRCSNWSLSELTPSQIVYAATDAWIGRELYLRMRAVGLLPQ